MDRIHDMRLFRLGEVDRVPGGLSCIVSAQADAGGGPRRQRLLFQAMDCAITYEPPEADFASVLKENEESLKKILSICMRTGGPEEIDIPFVFPEPGARRACPEGATQVFTDGSLSPSGNGGWAGIIVHAGGEIVEKTGSEQGSSSNRAELMAVARTLDSLGPGGPVIVHTDSRYVIRGAEVWLANWERNGYITALNRPVKNRDLWESVSETMKRREIHFRWVPSSGDNSFHRRCDLLARAMSKDGAQ
ncbi:MAG: ribonuclease HI [Spirochaetes bacterium]|nr:ribonuclease HI [Spirochaetota bacterium]